MINKISIYIYREREREREILYEISQINQKFIKKS